MARNFVFNMGYDTSHITSVLASESLERDSKVVLVTPKNRDERQENSIKDIRNYLDTLDIDTSLQVFPAGSSFQEDLENFASLFSRLEDIVLSLSGGPRDFLVPLTAASVISPGNIQKTVFRSDIDSELREVEMPEAVFDLDSSSMQVLGKLEEDDMPAPELAGHVDFSESTLYRKLGKLEEKGVVETRTEESSKIYSITPTAEIILEDN